MLLAVVFPDKVIVGRYMLLFDNFESFEKATTAWQNIAGQKNSLKCFSSPAPILKGKVKVKTDTSGKYIPAPASGSLASILYCSFPSFV